MFNDNFQKKENPQNLKEGRWTIKMAMGGWIFHSPGSPPRTPSPTSSGSACGCLCHPHIGPFCYLMRLSTRCACNFWVSANLSEAALLADRLRQGGTMTVTCAFEIIGAWRLSVQSKIKWHEAGPHHPGRQARETWTAILPPTPPGKAELHVIVSGTKQCLWPWIINLYGSWKYSNDSEIFA